MYVYVYIYKCIFIRIHIYKIDEKSFLKYSYVCRRFVKIEVWLHLKSVFSSILYVTLKKKYKKLMYIHTYI